jgi:hypothetical protein
MIGPGKIWAILIIIIIVSTTISGIVWFYFYHSENNDNTRNLQNIVQKYHTMKSGLKEIKAQKTELSATFSENVIGNGVRKYSDFQGRLLVIESYERNSLVRISYNSTDNKKMDIIEYYIPETGLLDHTEYDINDDGISEIYEKDENNDGIISVNEIKINMGGKFLPMGSFGIVAM